MLKLYEKYLEIIDRHLEKIFQDQKPFIHCKIGCSHCCEIGEYPFSRLEMEYLMQGYIKLPQNIKKEIKNNISKLLSQKPNQGQYLYKCPFLFEKQCILYERRGLICRTFGLASYDILNGQKIVKLPECSKNGLNYSEIYDSDTGTVDMDKFKSFGSETLLPRPFDLNFMTKELLKGLECIEFGDIRPLIEWFSVSNNL